MITALLLIAAQASAAPVAPDPRIAARVDRVLRQTPVIDGHNDLAWEIRDTHGAKVESLDLAADTRPLQTDIPRLRKGRVGAQFWSVWIPADTTGPRAVEMTLEQIDIVRRFVAANPAALEQATSAADIRRIERAGRDRVADRRRGRASDRRAPLRAAPISRARRRLHDADA
ncbi:membrane dipeptidase [Sphingomonas sp. 22R3R2A-7]|uniref:membrane dipeptidase n=1 Tax=Sphingomonas sp. 22R3R2A-7 TaxID=3050230 RepID=UPI002FE205BD